MAQNYLSDKDVGFGTAGDPVKTGKEQAYLSDSDVGFESPGYGLKDFGGDLASVVTKGVMAVPQALVGLADIATNGQAGKALEGAGVRFNEANQIADSWKSDSLKAQQKEFQDAQGIGGKAVAALSNPGLVASTVAESIPSMFLGGAVAKGAGLAIPALAGRAGLAAAGEGAVMAGSQAESIRQQTTDGLLTPAQSALAAGTGVAGGLIGAAGARAAKALGIGDVDTMIANGATQGAREGVGLASRVGRGALSEGVLEELPQSLVETAFGNVALDKPVTEGMDEAAVLGTLSGGLMGGVAGGLSRPAKPSQQMGIDPNAGPLSRAAAASVDSAPPPQLGFSPLAGTPIIYPDGSVALNSEQEFQKRTGVGQGMDLSKIAQPSQPLAAEKKSAQSAPVAPVSEPVPLEQRSLDELRQAFRSAQDPAIRKTLAAEIRKRRAAMPDPLAPVQQTIEESPISEPQATQAVESQPQEAPPAPIGQPLTDTSTNMLGRGADPLQSIIEEQNNARRAADELRGTAGASTVTRGDITPPSVESPVADVRSGGGNDDAGTAQPDANGDAGSGVGSAASGATALRPDNWRGNAIKAGKVARSLGLDPKGKRLKEIVAEIDAVDAGSGVSAKPVSREQAIRDAWRKEPRTIGKWTPISVESEGQKADMLVNQKRAGGDKDGALHVVNIRMGKMLKDMEREPIAYTFRLTADNRLVEEGIPTVATQGQIAAWKGAGFALDDKQANVQNTPSSTAGTEAKASPVEARAPEGGNAASDTGVPAAPGAGDVQADGVNLSKNPRELNTSAEPVQKTSKNEQVAQAKNEAPAENKFAEYDALARQYGYEVRPDGSIGSDGKFTGVTMSVKKGRLRFEGKSGNLLASYAPVPESLGKFLESFWYAEKKKPAAQAENPAEPVNPEPSKAAQPKAEKPAEDDAFMGVEDQTQTASFKKWFAGSKVVDDQGNPLVVYHGTNADITGFDISKFGKTDGGWAGKGFYFSPWAVESGWYSKGDGGNIVPVYLSINNPLEWKVGTEGGRKLRDKKRELGSEGFSKWAQDQGYDGVHMTSPDIGNTRGQDEWVAFRPEQIKSAIGNRGTFDPANPDITFAGTKDKSKRQGTPVDRAIMDMAGEGREANEILSFIAKTSKSPYRRQLAQKLLATGANPAVSLGGEMGGGAGFRFLAKYSRKNHEVTLSEAAADRAEQIFLHETVHSATLLALDKGGLIATQMNRLYESVKAQGGAEGQYGLKNVGEFVAEAFTNPDFQKALKGMKADNGSLWDRFVNIVRRILGMEPRQQDALSKALELGAGVMRENIPLRAAKSFRAEDGPAFAGEDQTETPEFQRWFGDSKVVDANGKPLVVYHGTSSDFSEFDREKSGKGPSKLGFWFTDLPDFGENFGNTLMPTYVSLRNPKRLTKNQWDSIRENHGGDPAFFSALRDKYLAEGFDGVFVPGGKTTVGKFEVQEPSVYAAFRPEQIKSAIGNNGNFDPDDADIAHFGIADAVEQIKAFDVKSAPKSAWAHYRGMALQALGRRQLVDLYGDEFGPHLKQYDYLVQQMDAEKNETGAEADDIAQRWGKLKDEKALAELMHDATLAKMDPDKPMPAGYSKAEYDKLKTRFNTLSPEAKTLYREARDMYVAHYKAVQQAIKDRIERSEMSPGEKKRMMAQLDDKLFKELQGVYFPLARFGQYVIVVKDANGQVVNVTRAETVKEAEQARKELQKAFPASSGNTVGKVLKQAEFNAGRDAVGKGFMADLMNALDEKGVDDELRDTVAQLYLSSLPDLSWAKHGIHRKGTPGFSQDARRAFAQNAFHGARYLAKLRYSDQLQDELAGMQEYVKAFEGVEEYDSIQGQQVVDEMVKRHEWLMNPKASPVSTALTSFGFLFHMGLSPASAMVNLTQTALVAYPQMGAKWGFTKAGAALTKASEEVVRAKNDLSKALKGDELYAFDRAVKDGTIDVTMAHDLAGIAQGEDQGVMWKVRPVMRWASFMFHHAEKFNRQATFLAAFRLSKESNPEKPLDWHYEAAKKATYDGHYDYSSANRPRLMQGNWQRVILLFKAFAQNTIYTLARNAYLSVKALDPKDRAQARKTLAGLMASHAAAAGVLGLPIVGPLLTVASWIGGDDDEPWDAEVAMQNAMAEMIGPKAAEVVARGFSRLTPFDLSGRVALNKLILPDVQEGLEGKEWAESAMAAALGPVAGIGVNMARGAQKITEGDYLRGLEDMMPTALRGPLKAVRYASEGAVDKTGIVITDEVSAAGVLGQASGFSPSQVRRDTERRSAIYAYDRALLERRSVLMRMMAEARIQGDEETAAEVQKDIQRFNEKNPTRRITPMNIAQSVRNRRKRIEEAEQGVYLPSKRRDALDAVSF